MWITEVDCMFKLDNMVYVKLSPSEIRDSISNKKMTTMISGLEKGEVQRLLLKEIVEDLNQQTNQWLEWLINGCNKWDILNCLQIKTERVFSIKY